MGIISYKPLIDDMTWSYSRIEAFNDCPYRFFLRYIKRHKENDKFYSSYGSFIHKILERYYKGELTKDEMLTTFLLDFKKEVRGTRPKESTVQKYITAGCEYLKGFSPFPFKMIAVEKRVEFRIGKYNFIGFIDYLGYDDDGTICIVDNKSRDLKPRSNRAKPTVKDKELDKMLRQLYLYAVAIEQEYGVLPKLLCFNCFKQHFRISRCADKVDVIVTDSPLLLSALYNNSELLGNEFNDLVAKIFKSYNSANYLIHRSKPYNPNGRLQTEKESDELADKIKSLLDKYAIEYSDVDGDTTGYDKIVGEVYAKLILEAKKA